MSNKTPYMKCKQKIIDNYMKKFERRELKGANNKIIKNRMQAVAVALSISDKICESKISTKDIAYKEERVNKMLYGKDGKLLNTKLQLSNVKNAIFLMNYYKKKKKTKKLRELREALITRTLLACFENNVTKNVQKEIKKCLD
jgi:hypothetical protein